MTITVSYCRAVSHDHERALGEFEHHVLLAILRLEADAYSLPIVRELESATGRPIAPAAVYIAMRRLEKRGLVSSEMRLAPAEEGGRRRRYFQLKPGAIEYLRRARRTLRRLWRGVAPVLDES